ncbi:EF-hand domain-containing D1 [Brachionus plicatilis]|uniref:EF-hand domain-containing D1 n=1 Tax=Brachionus plicatilis TaxID=10195 RepID=A0A3M7Q5B1_BRAPC|nr:EF-hand domain-containing D1 [Brachionus plicatilis]
MSKIWIKFIFCIFFVQFKIFAGQDSVCDPPSSDDLKIPSLPVNGKFRVLIEKNADGITEETTEIYDGLNNVGIITYYLASIKTKMYAYYKINELITIAGDVCKVYPLNTSIGLTPFQIINVNGSQHIASPLTVLSLSQDLNFKFIGSDGFVRGIPVNEWQYCIEPIQGSAFLKITVSFSDEKKWTPALQIKSFPSIPVQVSIQYRSPNETAIKNEFYSITKFRELDFVQEEEYFTPKGIYCPGRKSVMKLPQIPNSFAFANQVVVPFPNSFDKVGTIETLFEEYNLENKVFHMAYSSANSISNEIHDFNTGLVYKTDRKTGNCLVSNITGSSVDSLKNGSFIYERNPSQIFDLEESSAQFVGLKRVNGINCYVWIGQRALNGINSSIEWYFLSDLWNLTDYGIMGQRYSVPIQVIMYLPVPTQQDINKNQILEVKNNIFAFSPIPFVDRDYDINSCYENSAKKYFIFELGADLSHIIKSNLYEFRRSLIKILHEEIKVTILRISQMEIVFDPNGVFVLFTLLDKPKSYGPVPYPKDDLPLEDAAKRLRESIEKDKIQIEFKSFEDNDEYIVPVFKDSLLEIGNYKEGFVEINNIKANRKYSGGAVAIVTIVAVVNGLIFGLFLTLLIKSKKINLSFL